MSQKWLLPLNAGGLELCHFASLPGAFPGHFHEYWLLGCLVSGKRRMLCAGKAIELGPGDLIALNPGEIHACACDSGANCEYVCLHIPDLAEALGQAAASLRFGKTVWRGRQANFLALAAYLEKGRWDGAARGLLAGTCAGMMQAVQAVRAPVGRIGRLLGRMLHDPGAELNLELLAQWAGTGKYYLTRQFRAETGLTPWRYLTNLRVNFGRELLREGASVAESALEAGFYDQSHFSRCFRSNYGITPGYYRRACARFR